WFVPIVADAEAGFGGHLNVFELTKAMIAAGAAGVHLEDQLASEKKCGHMGGKVLLPTSWAIRNLVAAPLAPAAPSAPTPPPPASPPPRASTARTPASSRRSRAASPTRRTATSSGARRPSPT